MGELIGYARCSTVLQDLTAADLMEVFSFGRATVYRTLERHRADHWGRALLAA